MGVLRLCPASLHWLAMLAMMIAASLAADKKTQICLDGSAILGGLLSIGRNDNWQPNKTGAATCGEPKGYFVVRSESMLFAIQRANAKLLSPIGVELGFWAFDTCNSDTVGEMLVTSEFTSKSAPQDGAAFVEPPCARGQRPRRLLAFAGMSTSSIAVKLADNGLSALVPMLSTYATSTNMKLKHNTLTTQPLNDVEAQAIASVLLHFGVKKVTLVKTSHDNREYVDDLTDNLQGVLELCSKHIQVKTKVISVLDKSLADKLVGDAIVLIADNSDTEQFFRQLSLEKNLSEKLFVVGDGIAATLYPPSAEPGIAAIMKNTIGLGQLQLVKKNENFDAYLRNVTLAQSCARNPWLAQLIAKQHHKCEYNCSRERGFLIGECKEKQRCCTGDEKLTVGAEETHAIRNAHFDSMAAVSVARALLELHRRLCKGVRGFCDKLRDVSGDELFNTILAVSTRNGSEEDAFDSRKSGPPYLTVSQFREVSNGTFEWTDLGSFDGSAPLTCDNYNERLRHVSFGNFSISVAPSGTALPPEMGSTTSYLLILVPVGAIIIAVLCATVVILKLRDSRQFVETVKKLTQMHDDLTKHKEVVLNPNVSIQDQACVLNYDSRYELAPQDLRCDKKLLGKGYFGKVCRGYLFSQQVDRTMIVVAVKSPMHSFDCDELNCMITEMKVMQAVGRHPNVLNLIGCLTRDLVKGQLQIVTEYCKYGNIHEFLRKRRASFVDELSEIQLNQADESRDSAKATSVSTTADYVGSISIYTEGMQQHSWKLDKEKVKTSDLFAFCYQIACGMEFLSQKQVLHRDLAARNILINRSFAVKVADFGLSRQAEIYRSRKIVPVPRKWMPVETLQHNDFTSKSDVWSFGVLMWEIFTLGQTPYAFIEEDILNFIKSGRRLDKPDFATEEIYALMCKCWLENPAQRPTFTHCKQELYALLFEEFPLVHNRLIDFLAKIQEEIHARLLVD